jgi:MFS family permease
MPPRRDSHTAPGGTASASVPQDDPAPDGSSGAGGAPPPTSAGFSRREWRALAPLCAVYGLRLLGLYLVLPVLSVHARSLEGSTAFLTGLTLGAYGFTNMLLVLPFGALSDAIGRKRVLALGLVLFAGGSFLAAGARDIAGLVAGRALQGAGAVSSVVVALVGDVTRPEVRGRAMALLGTSIAAAFAVGVVGGPSLAGEFGVPALFLVTGALAMVSLVLVLAVVPRTPRARADDHEPGMAEVRSALHEPALLKLDAGMFILHLAVTAVFVVVPILLDRLLPPFHLWRIYAPVIALGTVVLVTTMQRAERAGVLRGVLHAGIVLFGCAFLTLRLFAESLAGIVAGLALFVCAFALLEPTLTALLTRYAKPANRGAAAGAFNMAGFLGAFVGGTTGGLLLESHDDLFLVLAGLSLVWLLAARRLPAPSVPGAGSGGGPAPRERRAET